MMNKNEIIKLFEYLGEQNVDDLYHYGCLKLSGFDEDKSYELIPLLKELWLKDENDASISTISDALYDNFEDLDLENMTAREILINILYRR